MFKGFNEFFSYSKSQRRGLWLLLGLAVVLTAGLYFDELLYDPADYDLKAYYQAVAQAKAQSAERDSLIKTRLRPFDPNKATTSYLMEIGLTEKLANRLSNYVQKGGRFRESEDLLKIYGMDTGWYEQVKNFVSIEPEWREEKYSSKPAYTFASFDPNQISKERLEAMGLHPWQAKNVLSYREKYRPFKNDSDIFEVYGVDSILASKMLPHIEIDTSILDSAKASPKNPPLVVNINTADSLTLLKVKGFGGFTAHKILTLREALGGFHSTRQIIGVFPIDSARYANVKNQIVCEGKFQKLNLNKATFKELQNHPYLDYDLVKNIVSFREDIRLFKSVGELQHIELVDEVLFSKIAPYFYVEENLGQEKE